MRGGDRVVDNSLKDLSSKDRFLSMLTGRGLFIILNKSESSVSSEEVLVSRRFTLPFCAFSFDVGHIFAKN